MNLLVSMIFLLVTTKDSIYQPLGVTLDNTGDIGVGYTGNPTVRQSSPRENIQPTPAAACWDLSDFHLDSVLESSENRHLTHENMTPWLTPRDTSNLDSSRLGDVLMNSINYNGNVLK